MKTDLLLQTLQSQMHSLATTLAPQAMHNTFSSRFDHQLFRTYSTAIRDYLQETWDNLEKLRSLVFEQRSNEIQTDDKLCDANKLQQIAWLADRLAAQIEALRKEGVSWSLRFHDSAHLALGKRHAELLKHQDYERRLVEMKQHRLDALKQVETLQAQQKLHKEIDALDERLLRCRNALATIERALARLTR